MRIRPEEKDRKTPSFNWTLWLKWILVSTLGWVIGWAMTNQFVIGAVVGVMQWVVLRPLIRQDGWWILASATGWAVGVSFVSLVLQPESPITGRAIIGMGVGLAQWLVLRRQVYRGWWWIVLSTLGWAIGMMGILGEPLAGAVAGAVTGVALEFLLRYPRSGPEETRDRGVGREQ